MSSEVTMSQVELHATEQRATKDSSHDACVPVAQLVESNTKVVGLIPRGYTHTLTKMCSLIALRDALYLQNDYM